jgi:polar amino acid transport system permease protein
MKPDTLRHRTPQVGEWYSRGLFSVMLLVVITVTLTGCAVGKTSYNWNFGIVAQYTNLLLQGIKLTLLLTVTVVTSGMVWGIFVALGRLSSFLPLRALTTAYVEVMRGTPLLVQLVWVYFALPIVTGIQLPTFPAIALALTLNAGAFFGETFRSGIQSVGKGQIDAAKAVGVSQFHVFRFIVLPQAVRTVLPVLISLSIGYFKDTALASTLGLAELTYNGNMAAFDSYRPLEILTTVAVLYFAIAFPSAQLARRVELRLRRHLS